MRDFLDRLAREAGELSLSHFGKLRREDIHSKQAKNDYVTEVDVAVERFIVERILLTHPDHAIFGEETGKQGNNQDHLWFIDPIDGTTNFIHSHPFFCVSIAYQEKGQLQAAAIYAPYLKEMFLATRGCGAFLNDQKICISSCARLDQALLATGFICLRTGEHSINPAIFKEMLGICTDIRREGSAALNLAYVAAGRLDGFWEFGLAPYDKAAGILLIEEAGGRVEEIGGGQDLLYGKSICAGNKTLLKQLQTALRKVQSICSVTAGHPPRRTPVTSK
jgi:myo-inositol-1(or 4)-monophosphatase